MRKTVAVPMKDETALAPYDAARATVAKMHDALPAILKANRSVNKGYDYRKTAEMMRQILKAAGDKTMERKAEAMRVRCEHHIGGLLIDQLISGERAGRGHTKQKNRMSRAGDIRPARPTLDDLGLKHSQRSQMSKWQRMAKFLPLPQLEEVLAKASAENKSLQIEVNTAIGYAVSHHKQAVI